MLSYAQLRERFKTTSDEELFEWYSKDPSNDIRMGGTAAFCAARYGKIKVFTLLTNEIANDDAHWYFFSACEGGHLDMINMLIEKGVTNWDTGMIGACHGGHLEVVKMMIEKRGGASSFACDGLVVACQNGHMHIVEFMLELGANNWDKALEAACYGGHLEIAKLMVSKDTFAHLFSGNLFLGVYAAGYWNPGMLDACRGGHMEVIKYMVDEGADAFSNGMVIGCSLGRLDIIDFMIEKGACNWEHGMARACARGQLGAINRMIHMGAREFRFLFAQKHEAVQYDVVCHHYDKFNDKKIIPKHLMDKIKSDCVTALEEFFTCSDLSRFIVKFLFV